MDDTDRVKAKLNIVDLVSNYVTLKRSGKNFFGLCPFHNEKTPSFTVNEELQRFKCFGCGIGGDSIEFIKLYNKVDFKEALETAAKLAGVELTKTYNKSKKNTNEVHELLELNTFASKLYNYVLVTHPSGKVYLEYLKKRGLSDDTLKQFQVGCVPKRGVLQAFTKKGFTDDKLIKYGFAVKRQNELLDKFRARVIFPVQNNIGDIVGFTARIIDDNPYAPKYLNTPQTDVYKKKEILYGLFQAKKAISNKDSVLILEGHMDVLSSFQAGVENVVGVQGTSLGLEHLQLLKRYTTNLSFCFDSDAAGQKALNRSITLAESLGFNIKVIDLEDTKDPDEYIIKYGVQAWQKASNNPLDIIDYFNKKLSVTIDLNNIDGKIEFIKRILPYITSIQDNIKKEYYLEQLSQITDIPKERLQSTFTSQIQKVEDEIVSTSIKKLSREEYIIILILQNLDASRDIKDKIDFNIIKDDEIRTIIQNLLDKKITLKDIDNDTITELYMRNLNLDLNPDKIQQEILKTQEILKKDLIKEELTKNRREIAQAEIIGDSTKAEDILEHIKNII